MPTYTIQGADGKVYTVNAADGTSPDSVLSLVRDTIANQKQVDSQSYVGELGRDVVRAVGSGVHALARPLEELPEMAQSLPGIGTIAKHLPGVQQGLDQGNQAWKSLVSPASDALRGWGDDISGSVLARKTPDLATAWQKEGLTGAAKSIGSTAVESGLPLAAAAAGSLFAPEVAAPVAEEALAPEVASLAPKIGAAGKAAMAAIFPQEYSNIRDTQEQQGVKDVGAATAGAIVSTALQEAGGAVSNLTRPATEVLERGVMAALTRTGTAGLEAGGVGIIQSVVDQAAGHLNPLDKQNLVNTLQSGIIGAVTGAGVHGGMEGIRGGVGKLAGAVDTQPGEPLHTIDVLTPAATEGGLPVSSRLDILSHPTADGTVVVRGADNKPTPMSLSDIEAMRPPAPNGEPRRPLSEELADISAQKQKAAEAQQQKQAQGADPEFDAIVERYKSRYGLDDAGHYAEATLGRPRYGSAAAEAAGAGGPGAPPPAAAPAGTPPAPAAPGQPAPVIPPAEGLTPEAKLNQQLGGAPSPTEPPGGPPVGEQPAGGTAPDVAPTGSNPAQIKTAEQVALAHQLLNNPELLKISADRRGISVEQAIEHLHAALEEMGHPVPDVPRAPDVPQAPPPTDVTAAVKQAAAEGAPPEAPAPPPAAPPEAQAPPPEEIGAQAAPEKPTVAETAVADVGDATMDPVEGRKKPVTKARVAAATEMLNAAREKYFAGAAIDDFQIDAVAQEMAADPTLTAKQALARFADPTEIPSGDDGAPPNPQEATPTAVAEPGVEPVADADAGTPVPAGTPEVGVTQLEPGVARGADTIQNKNVPMSKPRRGAQEGQVGATEQGAAELTAGHQAQQALTTDLDAHRDNNEITDAEHAEALDMVRPAQTPLEVGRTEDPVLKPLWRERLKLVNSLRDLYEAKGKLKKPAEKDTSPAAEKYRASEAGIQSVRDQIAAIDTRAADHARDYIDTVRTERARELAHLNDQLARTDLTKAQRRSLRAQRDEISVTKLFRHERGEDRPYGVPSPEEAATVSQAVRDHPDTMHLLDWLKSRVNDPARATIIEHVQNALRQLRIIGGDVHTRVVEHQDRDMPRPVLEALDKAAGVATVNHGEGVTHVFLNGGSMGDLAGASHETLLHEIIHGVTASLLEAAPHLPDGHPIKVAAEHLSDVISAVEAHLQDIRNGKVDAPDNPFLHEMLAGNTNALWNEHEILAWALSNPDVMDYLKSVPYKEPRGILSTLGQALVDGIRRVLGMRPDETSLLDKVLQAGGSLLSSKDSDYAHALDTIEYARRGEPAPEQTIHAQVRATERPSPEEQRKINRSFYKAEQSNKAAGFRDPYDTSFRTGVFDTSARLAHLSSLVSGFKTWLRPGRLEFMPSSWLRDTLRGMSEVAGNTVDDADKIEQQMRGTRAKLQEKLGNRVRDLQNFVSKSGQAVLNTAMTHARLDRVDPTEHGSLGEALAKDKAMQHYTKEMKDNAPTTKEYKQAKRGYERRVKELEGTWKAWDELGKQPGGQEAYKRVRQLYKDMYVATRAELDKRIDDLEIPAEAKENLRTLARGDVDEAAPDPEDPNHPTLPQDLLPKEYFPFRRFGDYALLVKDKAKQNRERYHFDSPAMRDRFMAQHAAERGLKPGSDDYNATYRKLNGLGEFKSHLVNESSEMLSKMFDIINRSKLGSGDTEDSISNAKEHLKDQLYQTYLMTLPERSIRRQFLHFEGITGHSADVLRVLRSSVNQAASQLPKLIHGADLQRKLETLDSLTKEGDPERAAKMRDVARAYTKQLDRAMNPQRQGGLERFSNEATFAMMMTSMASALRQPLAVLQSMPRMLTRYGPVSMKYLATYLGKFGNFQHMKYTDPDTGESFIQHPSLGNLASVKNNPLRARLFQELTDRDLFTQKQGNMILRDPNRFGNGGYGSAINKMGMAFSSMDHITREAVGMSFAEMEYAKARKAGLGHEDAIQRAVESSIRDTNDTIGNYTDLEKPGIMKSTGLGRMLGFLRMYAVNRTSYYFKTVRDLAKGGTYQNRMQAFGELSGALLLTSLTAGVGGNFGYGAMTSLIDIMRKLYLSKDDKERLQREDPLGAFNSDYWFKHEYLPRMLGADSFATKVAQRGVFSAATGWDVGTGLSQNDLWYRPGQQSNTIAGTVANTLVANLSPHVSEVNNIVQGADQIASGNVLKGIAALVPATARGTLNAYRLHNFGESTKKGDPVMRASEFTPSDVVGQVLGFTPERLLEQRDLNRNIQQWQNDVTQKRSGLLDAIRRVRDDPARTPEQVEDVGQQIESYNRSLPRSYLTGFALKKYELTPENILSSMESTDKRRANEFRGAPLSPGEAPFLFQPGEAVPMPLR